MADLANVGNAFESAEYLATWAAKETAQFGTIREAFFAEPNICARLVEFDAQSGENIDKIRLQKPLPMEMRGLASNVVKNFRDSLDQATFAATLLIRGKSSNRAHFPFGESPDDLENSLSRRLAVPCKGLPDELFPVLRSCEPYPTGNSYPGGNDVIRALGRIAGNNKHAVTITVTGTAVRTVLKPPGFEVGPGGATFLFQNGWDASKNEIKLFSFPPGGYVKADMQIAMSVVFGPGPLEGSSVDTVFEMLAHEVPVIIDRIKQATAEIIG